ncbi:hypothetical protein SS50377_25669 [Spironucleus salmonicida]|uniref:Uncharacterized protein n=1 Tax=Spironucleus salmonicida TaxID=348837 RepID=V6LDX3_9EUKA|nr:hypothetical protein SS50377_25669 [Spironucleus salmonicida]|eukprot:EST42695.1 Hypothetical protein SS50377_17716 [Spironucleus salmonicida]
MELLQIEKNTEALLKFISSYADTNQAFYDLFLFSYALFNEQINNGIDNLVVILKHDSQVQVQFFSSQNSRFISLIDSYKILLEKHLQFPTQGSEKQLNIFGIQLEQIVTYLKIIIHFSSQANIKDILLRFMQINIHYNIVSIQNYVFQLGSIIFKSKKNALKMLECASLLPKQGKNKTIYIRYIDKQSHLNDCCFYKQIIESLIIGLEVGLNWQVVCLCAGQCKLDDKIMKIFSTGDVEKIQLFLKQCIQ